MDKGIQPCWYPDFCPVSKTCFAQWSTGEGNGKTTSTVLPWELHKQYERKRDMTLPGRCTPPPQTPRLESVQYVNGEGQRNSFRKNEEAGPKQKWHSVVHVSGGESKVWCCKEQYCIGTWNVRSMNQGKLEVVKQEMARVNINILGISEPKWTGMGEFNSDDHYTYYCGQKSLRRNGVALIANKRTWNAVLGCKLKNDRWSRIIS